MKSIKKTIRIGIAAGAMICLGAVGQTSVLDASAHNPIVQTSFTPDPAPVVFGDELWVFTGCDKDAANSNYTMIGWQAFSTKDMQNWTDHGMILKDTDFSWCKANDAWASQCIERNGKYYFYFTTTNQSGGGRAIGVAVADNPEGPYKDVLGKPLCGPNWWYIDPTVIIDDDGQAWLMFGNPTCYYVKLKEDMVTLDGQIQEFPMTTEAFGPGQKNGCGYGEGPWIYKHKDLYYLVYACFYGSDGGESQAYATAPTVTGPWKFGNQIQKQSNCFTTHGGIIDYKDHSYLFYHKNGLKGGGTFNRSASCEEFTFNPDGSIPMINFTDAGPKQLEALNPYQRVEAETINFASGIKTEKIDAGTLAIGFIENGDYTKVSGVDFGEKGAAEFYASVSSNGSGGKIELHLDKIDGPVIGTVDVPVTGGWQEWTTVSGKCAGATGQHDLFLKFSGGASYLFNVDWWQFKETGDTSSVDPDEPVAGILGDVNGDGKITAIDLTLAKYGILKGFAVKAAEKAADVDFSGTVDKDDINWFVQFLTGQTDTYPERQIQQVDFTEMEKKFGSVNLAKCYKGENEHNPLITQYFGADPGVMEYNDRVYIYMTDDHLLYNNGQVTKETYSTINCLRCISSDDLVNWTDHGLINVAGQNGIAKWAGNSWAPTACHKKINGKEKFFLYFANNANGIGVLTSDSPTGPWSDPNGKAMIDRKTAGCTDVPWVFDPAVLVDDDGTGYLYFGGGTDGKPSDHPKSARCVQLSDSMTSIVGTPQVIDAPYMFEDSGIHKYNGKYYYSYCTNWNTGGNQYGLSTAAIDYMVSDSPLGPFTYKGEVFKNIGNFFGTTGNNHHTIMQFKGEWYLFYHAQYLQDVMNLKDMGYRSTHIDKITMNSDGTMQQVKGTKTGVSQIKALDPFTTVRAATFSHEGGIQIEGSGNSTVSAEKGDWFRVTGVDCKSASAITVKASAQSGGIIKVCTGSASGTPVAYIEIPAGGSMQEITTAVSGLSGKTNLNFVFNSNISMDSWELS